MSLRLWKLSPNYIPFISRILYQMCINMRIKVKTDRQGLPMWLLWSRRIIAFKLWFCSHKHVFKGFSLFVRNDRRFCKYIFDKGWLCNRLAFSINICFIFLTANILTRVSLCKLIVGYSCNKRVNQVKLTLSNLRIFSLRNVVKTTNN